MTSPYLNKPPRPIDEALKERGMDRKDVGLPEGANDDDRPVTTPRSRPRTMFYIPYAAAGLVAAGLFAGFLSTILTEDRNIASEESENVSDIVPAAGSNSDAGGGDTASGDAAIEDLGPAPSLQQE